MDVIGESHLVSLLLRTRDNVVHAGLSQELSLSRVLDALLEMASLFFHLSNLLIVQLLTVMVDVKEAGTSTPGITLKLTVRRLMLTILTLPPMTHANTTNL
jgi:hypothetical protein